MKTTKYIICGACLMASAMIVTSCSEDTLPSEGLIEDQVVAAGDTEGLVNAITKYMGTPTNPSANYGDCGYPSMMIYRDVMTADMPVRNLGYYYFTMFPYALSLGDNQIMTDIWNHYYGIVFRTNRVLSAADHDSSADALNIATAYMYRALAMFELAQMYEFFPTGTSLDSYYQELKGLTVPIITETTTEAQSFNNPRAPFYQMYRFILTDLDAAEKAINSTSEVGAKNKASKAAIAGLKARVWLTLGSRFDRFPDDLATALSHEEEALGENLGSGCELVPFGIATANDAFAYAAEYARYAINQGNTPLSEAEWSSPTTGFNDASPSAWLLAVLISTGDEMCTYYTWQSWTSYMCPEADYGVASLSYLASHEIDKNLFDEINIKDWRRATWIDPKHLEEGESAYDAYYAGKTLFSYDEWSQTEAYMGLKFHPGQGSRSASTTGNATDIPLMRIEEMYFIEAEATAHTQGVSAGTTLLATFMNTYRMKGGVFRCMASSIEDFTRKLLAQKRIEFWGEGLTYFDLRRTGQPVTRRYDGSNHPEKFQLNSFEGYVPAWTTLFIPRREGNLNSAVVLNPDASQVTSSYR